MTLTCADIVQNKVYKAFGEIPLKPMAAVSTRHFIRHTLQIDKIAGTFFRKAFFLQAEVNRLGGFDSLAVNKIVSKKNLLLNKIK